MRRSRWHVIKHVLFGVHSPSLMMIGLCWCQRKGVEVPDMSAEETLAAIRRSSNRAWKGFSE